jgi:hypothetical protein
MTPRKNHNKRKCRGIGRDRKLAVQKIMEAIVKIIWGARRLSVVRFTEQHFVVNVDGIKLLMHAPYCFRLDRVSESKYLCQILKFDPITESFGVQIWTRDRKVLFAEYTGSAVEIASFHRGDWEDALISAANDIFGPSSLLRIDPPTRSRSIERARSGPLIIDIPEGLWIQLRKILFHDPANIEPSSSE